MEFTTAVKGYHYIRSFWLPEPEKNLIYSHERGNTFNRFAIKVCENRKVIPVGHLPKEISWVIKYFRDRGATATATLSRVHYRQSSLYFCTREIVTPCRLCATMPGTVSNLLVLEKI